MPKNQYHDFTEGREYRECAECKGKNQEGHEHLRYYLGKFMCKQCRQDSDAIIGKSAE